MRHGGFVVFPSEFLAVQGHEVRLVCVHDLGRKHRVRVQNHRKATWHISHAISIARASPDNRAKATHLCPQVLNRFYELPLYASNSLFLASFLSNDSEFLRTLFSNLEASFSNYNKVILVDKRTSI